MPPGQNFQAIMSCMLDVAHDLPLYTVQDQVPGCRGGLCAGFRISSISVRAIRPEAVLFQCSYAS